MKDSHKLDDAALDVAASPKISNSSPVVEICICQNARETHSSLLWEKTKAVFLV